MQIICDEDLSEVKDVAHAWVGYTVIGGELNDIVPRVNSWNRDLESRGVNIEEIEINLSKGPYQGVIILVEEK